MARRGASMDAEQPTLLARAATAGGLQAPAAPLADRMRPRSLEEVLGQDRLLAGGRLLTRAIEGDHVPSMILWGPPGSGKTTLAHVVANKTKNVFVAFSAVLGGVAEVRKVVEEARERRNYQGRGTILFVDEIHRFNKAQQDAFLPHVEGGIITLIGATTENPSFSVNAAILSRCKVFRLEPLGDAAIAELVRRALTDDTRGLGKRQITIDDEALESISKDARGDARRALGTVEACAELVTDEELLTVAHVERAAEARTLLYDKSGEEHYNVVSALIKSMRGSDPDAAIYWCMRMLEAGDDPLFLLRRMIIFASEDVGNADPRALQIAVNADAAFRRIGMPEGIFPISHACLYLASCPKSNSVGKAFGAAQNVIRERGAMPVPKKLRNAVTGLMRAEEYGLGYKYAHDFDGGFAAGETYLPEGLEDRTFYEPTEHGLEKSIKERLERIRAAFEPKDED